MSEISMREMLEAGVHFGHQTRYWNPKMAAYLYGHRNKIHIIDLEKTKVLLQEALNFVSKLSANKGTILFVGTKRAAQQIIKEEAQRCAMPYINLRWLGGLLTNYKTVKQSINRLKELEEMKSDGGMDRMSKKEILHFEREQEKLDRNLSGIKDMNGWPDALFVIDVGYEDIAVSEAVKLKIPVIGIVDSNNSPAGVDYVIPGNDDAIRSIRLYTKAVADAIITGKDSVAHLGEGGDKDEFVELDAEGAPVIEAKQEKVPVKKKTVRKKTRKATETEADGGIAKEDEVKSEAQPEEQAAGAATGQDSPGGTEQPQVAEAVAEGAGDKEDGAGAGAQTEEQAAEAATQQAVTDEVAATESAAPGAGGAGEQGEAPATAAQAEQPAGDAATADPEPAETAKPKRTATKSAGARSPAKKAPAKTTAKSSAKTAAKATVKTPAKTAPKTAAKTPAKHRPKRRQRRRPKHRQRRRPKHRPKHRLKRRQKRRPKPPLKARQRPLQGHRQKPRQNRKVLQNRTAQPLKIKPTRNRIEKYYANFCITGKRVAGQDRRGDDGL